MVGFQDNTIFLLCSFVLKQKNQKFKADINFMTKLRPQTSAQYNSTSSLSELASDNIAYKYLPIVFSACFDT